MLRSGAPVLARRKAGLARVRVLPLDWAALARNAESVRANARARSMLPVLSDGRDAVQAVVELAGEARGLRRQLQGLERARRLCAASGIGAGSPCDFKTDSASAQCTSGATAGHERGQTANIVCPERDRDTDESISNTSAVCGGQADCNSVRDAGCTAPSEKYSPHSNDDQPNANAGGKSHYLTSAALAQGTKRSALATDSSSVECTTAHENTAGATVAPAEMRKRIAEVRGQLSRTEKQLHSLAAALPNTTHPAYPLGEENVVVQRYGGPVVHAPEGAPDHVALAERLGIADWDAGGRAAGAGFVFLRGRGALLEAALVAYALQTALRRGWTPVSPPDIVRAGALRATGFYPRRPGADSQSGHCLGRSPDAHVYSVRDPDGQSDLVLAGTSEVSLAASLASTTVGPAPQRLVAVSHCFRPEDDGRSLHRVRQFTKVELFALCAPPDSDALYAEILGLQAAILGGLSRATPPGEGVAQERIALRTLEMRRGDELGASAAAKCDAEAWLPVSRRWLELASASHCTDYQSVRLDLRMRYGVARGEGGLAKGGVDRCIGSSTTGSAAAAIERRADSVRVSKEQPERGWTHPHTLNGTALAVPRVVQTILESCGAPDGRVLVPDVLRPFMLDGSAVL